MKNSKQIKLENAILSSYKVHKFSSFTPPFFEINMELTVIFKGKSNMLRARKVLEDAFGTQELDLTIGPDGTLTMKPSTRRAAKKKRLPLVKP